MSKSREYRRNHYAVTRDRGKAAEHTCTDCPAPAHEWSHIHDTDPTVVGNYEPRCRSCHRRYDFEVYRPHIVAANTGRERSAEEKRATSERMKAWHSTPEGQAHSERRKAYYASPEGRAEVERQKAAHRERTRAWYDGPEGKAFLEKRRQDRLSKLEGVPSSE